jgi:hypothetical protein
MSIKRSPEIAAVLASLCLFSWLPAGVLAQGLPDIFSSARETLAPVRAVASFKPMTFLENLIVDGKSIVFTSHEDGRIYRIADGGNADAFSTLPGKVSGIAARNSGYLVTGFDVSGRAVAFLLDASGALRSTVVFPEAIFLNGVVRIGPTSFLIADSYKGVIWRFDEAGGGVSVWLDSELLKRSDPQNPTPAANGLRLHQNAVIVSNTQKMTLIRVPFGPDQSAGAPAVLRDKINVDDFAVMSDGSILAATHIYNNVVRIHPDGRIDIIAREKMTGSTSVALSGDGKTAYVTTNGGMFLPPPGGVAEAHLLAIDLTGMAR